MWEEFDNFIVQTTITKEWNRNENNNIYPYV